MRTARDERAREQTRTAAFTVARRLVVAWAESDDPGTPQESASAFMAMLDKDSLEDGWGNSFVLGFGTESVDEDDPFSLLLVEIASPGPDGEIGTDDDAAYWMSTAGEFNDGPFPRKENDG